MGGRQLTGEWGLGRMGWIRVGGRQLTGEWGFKKVGVDKSAWETVDW